MKQVKKSIQLLAILLLLKIVMEVFEVSALPTMVTMSNMQSMIIFDFILKIIIHPIFYIVICLGSLLYVVIRIGQTKDQTEKKSYTKTLASLISLAIFYVLVPSLVDLFQKVTGN